MALIFDQRIFEKSIQELVESFDPTGLEKNDIEALVNLIIAKQSSNAADEFPPDISSLQDWQVCAVIEALKVDAKIKYFNIKRAEMSLRIAELLKEMLHSNKTILSLNINLSQGTQKQAWENIIEGIKLNRTIETINCKDSTTQSFAITLLENISSNVLDIGFAFNIHIPKVIQQITNFIKHNKHIAVLRIYYTVYSPDIDNFSSSIIDALENNNTLHELYLFWAGEDSFPIQLTPVTISKFYKLFETNHTLSALSSFQTFDAPKKNGMDIALQHMVATNYKIAENFTSALCSPNYLKTDNRELNQEQRILLTKYMRASKNSIKYLLTKFDLLGEALTSQYAVKYGIDELKNDYTNQFQFIEKFTQNKLFWNVQCFNQYHRNKVQKIIDKLDQARNDHYFHLQGVTKNICSKKIDAGGLSLDLWSHIAFYLKSEDVKHSDDEIFNYEEPPIILYTFDINSCCLL